jgi:hypothetical protein
MAGEPIHEAVGRWTGFIVEWTLRLVVAFIALTVLVWCVVATVSEPWAIIGVPISAYFLLGMLVPDQLVAGRKWVGRHLSKPYNRYFVPYGAEPIEAAAEALFAFLSGLFKAAFGMALVVVGITICMVVGFMLFKGASALPVSVAVIIGALIIGGALGSRRR